MIKITSCNFDELLRGVPPEESAIYKDFVRQKHWAWFVPLFVSSDVFIVRINNYIKEAANAHTTTNSARQQGLFVDTAVSRVSRLFVPVGKSPDSLSEGSPRGSPRSLPTMGVSPHRQGIFVSSATGLQGDQLASKHFDSWDPGVRQSLESIIQRQDKGMADTTQQLNDLRCDFDDSLQTLRQDYQQGFAQFTQGHKSQFDQLEWDTNRMHTQIRNVDAQVKVLQVSLNKVASNEELAVVEHNSKVRIGEVGQRLDVMRQEMHSKYVLIDESIHDLRERMDSMEQKQSAAVPQVPDARSDSQSVRQPVSLGVSDNIDMYHTPMGMGEFPSHVLHLTMRKVSEGPPISVSTHFTLISCVLDRGSGVGNYVHSGTPVATVDVGVGVVWSVSNGVYHPFLPTGAAPAVGIANASVLYSVAQTNSVVPPTVQPGGIVVLSSSSIMTHANSTDQSSRFNNSQNTSVHVKELSVKMPSFDAESSNWTSCIQYFEDMVIEMKCEGIELNKLKICLEGKAKQVYRSFGKFCTRAEATWAHFEDDVD